MGWDESSVPDPQDPETFLRSKLDWDEPATGRHARTLARYRELIALRRRLPALTDPRLDRVNCRFDEVARWLAVDRPGVTVGVNFADQPMRMTIDAALGDVVFTTDGSVELVGGILTLPARSGAIVAARAGQDD